MFKIKIKDIAFTSLFAIALMIVSIAILNTNKTANNNIFVLLTFIFNILLIFYNLLQSVKKHNYSFDNILWLFSFFFFGIAPLLQYLTGKHMWNLIPTESEIIRTNFYILIWLVFYLLGKVFGKKYRVVMSVRKNQKTTKCDYYFDKVALLVLLMISGLIVVYYLSKIGFNNLMIRSTNVDDSIDSKAIGLITNHGFHNILLFNAVLHVLEAKKSKIKFTTVLAVIFFLIGCFPTGISRNMMASFYCGMLIILIDTAREKRWITWAIFGGLILVFPALSIFRNLNSFNTSNFTESILYNIQNTYLSGDYDAHQMFISIQRWAAKDGLTWGKQLLTVFLFFVPRSLWPGKSWGTGQLSFEATNQHWYTNVSAPLPAEGYINFGVPGIIIFSLIIGYITARLDNKYWAENNNLSMIRVIYPFSMLMFFFMNRGDLLSTWAYTFAQLFVGTVLYKFTIRKNKL